jgi:hypothetical protein
MSMAELDNNAAGGTLGRFTVRMSSLMIVVAETLALTSFVGVYDSLGIMNVILILVYGYAE